MLLMGARLPTKQRLIAPYGSTVYVRKKAFDSSGPRRREKAFESRWEREVYVGLSKVLDRGHVIYVKGADDAKDRFLHTLHVRHHLVDPGLPVADFKEVVAPKPKRKIPVKTPFDKVELRALERRGPELDQYIKDKGTTLLQEWDPEEAVRFIDSPAEINFGVYRHGRGTQLGGCVHYLIILSWARYCRM